MEISTKDLIKNLSSKKSNTYDVDKLKISDITNRQSQIIRIETETGPVYHFRMIDQEKRLFEVEHPISGEFIKVILIGSFKVGKRISTNSFLGSNIKKISLITLS